MKRRPYSSDAEEFILLHTSGKFDRFDCLKAVDLAEAQLLEDTRPLVSSIESLLTTIRIIDCSEFIPHELESALAAWERKYM